MSDSEWFARRQWRVELTDRAESQIEHLFLAAIVCEDPRLFGPPASGAEWSVSSQEIIMPREGDSGFRADVTFRRGNLRVVVELDGHEFHERTAGQVGRGNDRERALEAIGWRVTRFTGANVRRTADHGVERLKVYLHGLAAEEKRLARPDLAAIEAAEAAGDRDAVDRMLREAQERACRRLNLT